MEMRRTLLNDQRLPYKIWAEAINTSCYICNRCMVKPIIGKTTCEIYYSRVPNISYFKVFGLRFCILNTKDQLHKFVAKSQDVLFFGYTLNVSYYRV